jgi:RNA polymerase sigma-70 factor (ECF subfamily)
MREAAAGGDMDALLGMLAPDVVVHGDGGGKAQAIGKPLAGRQHVMRLLIDLLRQARILGVSLRLARVNGQPGAVMYDAEGRVVSVIELDVADGVVQSIHAVVNPDKLGHIGPVSDVARRPEKE